MKTTYSVNSEIDDQTIFIYNTKNFNKKNWLLNNFSTLKLIYTNDIELLEKCPNTRLLFDYNAVTEHINIEKSDNISCFSVSNLFDINFKIYKEFYQVYKNSTINFFKFDNNNETLGEKIISKDDKFNILNKYRYNIIFNSDTLIPKSLLECLQTKTLPVIYGDNKYSQIFNTKGWIFVNEINKLDLVDITNDYYNQHQESIEYNYRLVNNTIQSYSLDSIVSNLNTKKITILLSYYNQKNTLGEHLQTWINYPDEIKKFFTFMIIDDCSRTNCLEILDQYDLSSLTLQVLRSTEDLVCNIAGVRNLSAQKCDTEWMVILDMDTLIDSNMANELIKLTNLNKKKTAYKFNRIVPSDENHPKNNQMHPAVTLIRNEDYWRVGGCEEDLVGSYGQTDPCFWYRARNIINIVGCKNIYLKYLPAGESDINRNTKRNARIFQKKKKHNNWSKDFIRFKWKWLINNQI